MIRLQQFLCVCFSRGTCRLEPRESSDHSKGTEQNGRAGPVGADRRLARHVPGALRDREGFDRFPF